MSDKVQTLHPDPDKQGVNIDQKKYDAVRRAIIAALTEHGELTFAGLTRIVEEKLAGQFEGSIPWYTITVKLDLEARQVIGRVSGKKPQHLRLFQ